MHGNGEKIAERPYGLNVGLYLLAADPIYHPVVSAAEARIEAVGIGKKAESYTVLLYYDRLCRRLFIGISADYTLEARIFERFDSRDKSACALVGHMVIGQ